MSGLELARKLRRGRSAQPVILVTAYGDADTLDRARGAGVSDCFSKPFRIDTLRRSVRRALETHAARGRRLKRAA
jgi:two-component system response regulator (stage 0 sporulation protein F)